MFLAEYDMGDKVIISCALTGVLTDPKRFPVPVTPAQMAAEARAAFDQGAAIMHVHFRQQEPGKGHLPSWEPKVAVEIMDAIRSACPGVILNQSTGHRGPDYQAPLDCLRAVRPEVAACNAGTLNYLKINSDGSWSWPPGIFDNAPPKIKDFLDVMVDTNTQPEFECFDTGIVRSVEMYVRNGMYKGLPKYNFVMGVASGQPADVDLLPILLRLIMKGALHTDELMHEVVSPATGLTTERRISHVYVMDVATYPRLLLITDAAVNIAPDLETKRDIVQNAADLAAAIGILTPRIAILSAVETVTSRLRSTLDAAALCKMAERGQITGAMLDGPLALDNAISPEAAAEKGLNSPVAGRADILVVPDLEAGNMLAKQLTFLAGAKAAAVVLGARVPIVLTSRADDVATRVASCAVAVRMAERGHAPLKVAAG